VKRNHYELAQAMARGKSPKQKNRGVDIEEWNEK
jgi:hypothetical protein